MLPFLRSRIIFCLWASLLGGEPLADQFKRVGYVEICDEGGVAFDSLYAHFDALITWCQTYPAWAQKLYNAKERFIRSKDRNYYSTDFFGLYDESEREGRRLIAFYYSTHFHAFICSRYPELRQTPEILRFFEACLEVQKRYAHLFEEAASALGIETIFSSDCPSILVKVIKYLPSYVAIRPHYDGSVFSLFLNSTDNHSLLLSPYTSSLTLDDFFSPRRTCSPSVLLIPGELLKEFSIYPTPHIVAQSGKTRYATVAFAMRPNSISLKH